MAAARGATRAFAATRPPKTRRFFSRGGLDFLRPRFGLLAGLGGGPPAGPRRPRTPGGVPPSAGGAGARRGGSRGGRCAYQAAADPTALLENDQANCFIDFSFAFCGKSQDKPAAPARTAPENLFGDNGEDYEETDHLVDDEIPMSYVCAPNC